MVAFEWPALKADGGFDDPASANYYGSEHPEIKVGTLLAIPSRINLDTVQFETGEPAMIIAKALQNYGAYVVDNTAWDAFALITEFGPEGRVIDEFKMHFGFEFEGTGTAWHRDMLLLINLLYKVSENRPDNIGGGPTFDFKNRLAPVAPALITNNN
ncbi:MAG: hypothetical protein HC906_06355 [Bacteroidales bacterium]|nr:hypothetical protein [Bacteroidales bacterium]